MRPQTGRSLSRARFRNCENRKSWPRERRQVLILKISRPLQRWRNGPGVGRHLNPPPAHPTAPQASRRPPGTARPGKAVLCRSIPDVHQRRSSAPPVRMTKRGGSTRSLLHAGHLDGLVRRVRSLKTNAQTRHCAGSTRKRSPLCLSERTKCSRWPETSFSLIRTRAESSRAVCGRSLSTCLSAARTVSCRSMTLCGRGFFANGCTSDHTITHSMRLTPPSQWGDTEIPFRAPVERGGQFQWESYRSQERRFGECVCPGHLASRYTRTR